MGIIERMSKINKIPSITEMNNQLKVINNQMRAGYEITLAEWDIKHNR